MVEISPVASEALNKDFHFMDIFEIPANNVNTQIDNILSKLQDKEKLLYTAKITTLRDSVKEVADNCVNCKDEDNLKRLSDILSRIDLESIKDLKENPINNSSNRPVREEAA